MMDAMHSMANRCVFGAAIFAAGVAAAQGSDPSPAPVLAPGTTVEGEIRDANGNAFTVEAEEGDRWAVTVTPRGIDLIVEVLDPSGAARLSIDHTGGVAGDETAIWIAEAAGAYRLRIRPSSDKAGGRYDARADVARPATPEDHTRARAWRALSEGARLRVESAPETRALARVEYENALALLRELGDRRGEAVALVGLGAAVRATADLEAAVKHWQEALAHWRALEDRWQEAAVLKRIGDAQMNLGRGAEAAASLAAAPALLREAGDRSGEADAWNALGAAHETAGDGPQAAEAYEKALVVWREIGDRRGEADTLYNMGTRRWAAGDVQLALDAFLEALEASRAAGHRTGVASATLGIGQLYAELGDYPRGLHHLAQALAQARAAGSPRTEVPVLAAIGYAHRLRGAWDESRRAYLEGLEVAGRVGNPYAKRAAPFLLRNLGAVSMELGEHRASVDYLDQALAGFVEANTVGDQALVLTLLSRVYERQGDPAKARAHALDAASRGERSGAPRVQLLTLHRLAQLELLGGDLAEAERHVLAALDILEATRRAVRSADLRAYYVASARGVYDLHLDVLMARHAAQPEAGFDTAAFQAVERARARSLLELLAESQSGIREGVDPGLLDRERKLRARLSEAAERGARAPAGEVLPAAAAEVESLREELDRTESEIRKASPRYADLTRPAAVSVPELQSMLGEDTVLVEYSLGETASYVWAIGARSFTSARLPAMAQIDAAARRVAEAFATERKDAAAAAAELSRLVLGPVASALTAPRVVVVADGALHYIPFAALPHPSQGELLVARHEVVGLPSASTLGILRRELAARRPARNMLAVLADPVFDAGDERLGPRASLRTAAGAPHDGRLTRAADAAGLLAMPRLAFTRREAKAILKAVPPDSALAAFDFDASRDTILQEKLADYRFVHLATHGFFNSERPELSGLVLSLVDPQGRPQPGFLSAAEVFNMRLSADLVVLSGCRTALGREVRGEGLVGLNRGFMYAGAARVVSSLWPVDDAATAALMTRTYARLLPPSGERPAAALRGAQLELMKQERFRHPYFWAGFQLQGEWN